MENPSIPRSPSTKPSLLGRLLVATVALITLVVLFYAEEDWRGYHAWAQYKSQLEAKGEKLDWSDYVPPKVPDDQNFAMTPFLAPLFQFNSKPLEPGQSLWRDTNGYNRIQAFLSGIRTPDSPGTWTKGQMSDFSAGVEPRGEKARLDALAAMRLTNFNAWAEAMKAGTNAAPAAPTKPLSRTEAAVRLMAILDKGAPVFEELRAASQRPYARFNINYDADYVSTILLPHLAAVKNLSQGFRTRSAAELELGKTNDALADAVMGLYLSETIKNEPFLISKLVQISMIQLALQPVWEGLATHKWTEDQLAQLENRLSGMVILDNNDLRGERAFSLRALSQLGSMQKLSRSEDPYEAGAAGMRFAPGGWIALSQLDVARLFQDLIFPAMDAPNQRIYPDKVITDSAIVTQRLHDRFSPFRALATMLYPSFSKSAIKFALAQTSLNEAAVACALERYWLAHGRYPESLDAISPQYMKSIPHDLIGGEALKYRSAGNGTFILYSIGWNEKDDGGAVALNSGETPSVDQTRGDWVWQYPSR